MKICDNSCKIYQSFKYFMQVHSFHNDVHITLYLLGKAGQSLVWDPGRLSWEDRHCLFPFWIYSLQSLGLWTECLKYSKHHTIGFTHKFLSQYIFKNSKKKKSYEVWDNCNYSFYWLLIFFNINDNNKL